MFHICSRAAALKETAELHGSIEAVPLAAAAVRDRLIGGKNWAADWGEGQEKFFRWVARNPLKRPDEGIQENPSSFSWLGLVWLGFGLEKFGPGPSASRPWQGWELHLAQSRGQRFDKSRFARPEMEGIGSKFPALGELAGASWTRARRGFEITGNAAGGERGFQA